MSAWANSLGGRLVRFSKSEGEEVDLRNRQPCRDRASTVLALHAENNFTFLLRPREKL